MRLGCAGDFRACPGRMDPAAVGNMAASREVGGADLGLQAVWDPRVEPRSGAGGETLGLEGIKHDECLCRDPSASQDGAGFGLKRHWRTHAGRLNAVDELADGVRVDVADVDWPVGSWVHGLEDEACR